MGKTTIILLILLYSFTCCVAQVVVNPVFDRTDAPQFHLDKVEKLNNSTIVYCTYYAQQNSWANLSKRAYIEDVVSKQRYYLVRSEGLPLSPNERLFNNDEKVPVILYFPSIGTTCVFNLIDNPIEQSFNIYGIDLNAPPFSRSYSDYEVLRYVNLQEFYSQSGNIEKAIEYCKLELDGKKFLFGTRSSTVGASLYLLASLYYQVGNYSKAIEYGKKGILIDKNRTDITDDDLVLAYNNLSHYYDAIGDYKSAIEIAKVSKSILARTDTIREEYAAVLTNLSKFNNSIGNFNDALVYAKQSLSIKEKTVGKGSESFAISLSNLATSESNLGNYDEAIKIDKECLEIFVNNKGKYNIDNATIYANLSFNYSYMTNYQDAIINGKKACEIYEKNGINNVGYATILSNIAYEYFMLSCQRDENLQASLIKEELALSILYSDSAKNVAEKLSESYILLPTLLNNKAILLSLQGKLYEALDLQRKACELSNHATLEYSQQLQNLCLLQLYAGEKEEAIKTEKEAVNIYDDRIKHNLQSISTYHISKYWNSNNFFYNNIIPKCAYYTRDKEAISYLYDKTALFAKGFLLNSSIEIKDMLQVEEDSINTAIYIRLQNLYAQLDSITNINMNNELEKKERIILEIKENENTLIAKSVAYRRYIESFNCHWQTVQEKLTLNDIAIEFLKCPLGLLNDSVFYVALVLKKQFDSPLLIPLFNEQEIISSSSLCTPERLYELIWKPLSNELINVRNIYFSPVGILHEIGIEYLPCGQNEYVSEKYNCYRLSSTRKLIEDCKSNTIGKAALFGGISYEVTTEDDIVCDATNSCESPNKGIASVLNERGGFEALVSSQKEVETIETLLSKNKIETISFTKENGSEGNFKKLSGSNLKIIHLATHGMYVNKKDAEFYKKRNNYSFISLLSTNDASGESYSLTRSFLVMAGGNRLPCRIDIPTSGNDGILTALEVSRLNLRMVDIVVLSACQTALGDITEDGVFGLQRGFKKAGANTILMSLNRVDDEATRILMVEFYRNLMNGKTKRQSLQEAQQYLRKVDNGKYDNPKYWASFIMLDGLN